MIGRIVGSYTIVDKLGSGGMGEVYLAEHRRIARRAAIKFLLPSLSRDSDVVARFFNEARATSVIKHPGIVEIFDCDVVEERAYIVMEYLEGQSLAAALYRVGSFASEMASVASVAGQIASALSAAHAKGIIHRDMKPENVFLALDEGGEGNFTVKILDFGIAKLAGDSVVGAGSNTRTGSVLGTPVYMSPEQCRGLSTVDHRADIYALGCIMFEMVTGRHVFVKEAPGDLLVAHISEPAPRASSLVPAIPPPLDDLIARMLVKDPGQRPQSMAEVVAHLEGLLGTKSGEFARKIPVTSTMIGGVSLRPRVSLPSPVPNISTPAPPSRTGAGASGSQRVPSAVAGGTRVITNADSPGASTFRHTASELLSTASRKRNSRKSATLVIVGVIAAGVAVAIFLMAGQHHDANHAVTEPVTTGGGTVSPSTTSPTKGDPVRRAVEVPDEPQEAQPPVRTARAPVRIESKPTDAELWIGSEARPRGRTPLDVALPLGSRPVDAVLKSPGYSDMPISIDPARGKPLVVELANEAGKKPSKDPTPRRHSPHGPAHDSPKPQQTTERPTTKPDTGYFGVGD
jgi:serine/threonine-protein kinase